MTSRLLRRWAFMREHRWTSGRLSDYLDGELSGEERRRLEAHASICPGCERMLASLRRMLAELGSLRSAPRPGLAEGVIDRLREEP